MRSRVIVFTSWSSIREEQIDNSIHCNIFPQASIGVQIYSTRWTITFYINLPQMFVDAISTVSMQTFRNHDILHDIQAYGTYQFIPNAHHFSATQTNCLTVRHFLPHSQLHIELRETWYIRPVERRVIIASLRHIAAIHQFASNFDSWNCSH